MTSIDWILFAAILLFAALTLWAWNQIEPPNQPDAEAHRKFLDENTIVDRATRRNGKERRT
jgi:hypothetical protein